uniref:C2 domain-containing protein n=1 Tax=Globisporangium ultimum (strain ATCC 200006 / CBS 805.95 / DAOM BR144) TaxID=431595 RepID=K3WXL3_GLOUD
MPLVTTPRVCLKVLSAAEVGLRHGGAGSAVTTVDPYCQVKCGEVVLRTEAKAQTTTPVWNQVLRFGVKKPLGDVVTFKVYAFSNEDKDELLGEAELTIADLPADETIVHTLHLLRGEGSEPQFGTIEVEARYEPTFQAEERVGPDGKVVRTAPAVPVSVVSESSETTTRTNADGAQVRHTATTTTTTTSSSSSATEAENSTSATMTSSSEETKAVAATSKNASHTLVEQASTVDYSDKEPNYLVVTLLEAKGLLALDGTGIEASSDPFVKIHCTRNQSQRTRTQKQTLHPRWRQRFYFYLAKSGPQYLELVLEDQDYISNDFLGRCVINLNEWRERFDRTKQVFWLALEHKPKEGGQDMVFSDISPTRKMNYGRGKVCLALETRYMDRKIQTLEQGELDHVTVIPTTRGLRNVGSSAGADEGGPQENLNAGEDENAVDPNGDEDEDEDEDEGDDADEDPLKKETAEEKKIREEEHQKMFQELSNVQFLSGDYQIRVRVIEVRDLKPMDANGSCDPVVSIECLSQRQHTMVKQKQLSCVFDEYLYFNFKNMDKDTIQQGSIKVSVMDADGPRFLANSDSGTSRFDDMIGFFVVDIPYVYFQPDHEIHRKWVALVGNKKNNSDSIQGYLLLSIVVLGPGDKLKIHDPAEDKTTLDQDVASKKDINSLVLVPPRVSQTLHYLVVTVLIAEDLPDMDKSMLHSGGIDAYVRVYFAGQDILETRKVTVKGSGNISVEFHQELWFPVLLPCMSNNIFVSVWDNDLTTDELVANTLTPFLFSHVQKYPSQFKNRWANLYGPPLGYIMESKDRKMMFDNPAIASTYRGRVLLSMRVEDGSKSVNDRPHTRNLMSTPIRPAFKKYTLRAALFYGTEIPKFASKTRWNCNSRMSIRVSIGRHSIKSTRAENVGGICHWNQYLDIPDITFPEDLEQVPDVFVHLVRQQLSESRYICYARYTAKELFNDSGELKDARDIPPPQWINLIEDPVLDDLKDHDFTGNVLMNLRLEPSLFDETREKNTALLWREHSQKTAAYMKYTLFVHVFQGRSLPAADSNGLLDPYVKVTCGGSEGKVSTRMMTRDPCFYETVVLDVELPQDQEFLPKVSLQVYDWDQWDADDYVGGAKFNLTDFPQLSSTKYTKKRTSGEYMVPRPKWYPISYLTDGDTEGELLLSFDLIKKDTPGAIVEPPESIRPQTEEKFLEIIALGCRGLQPIGFMPVNTPFVKFEVGEVSKTNAAKLTNPSSKPSGRNPNFLERIVIPVTMPIDALFAPRLNISVYDQLLGGFYKPLIGVCSVDLSQKLPFSNGQPNPLYEEPGGKLFIGNPYVERSDDFSTFPGTIPTEIMREKSMSDARLSQASLSSRRGKVEQEETKDASQEAPTEEDIGAGILPPSSDATNLYTTGAESDYADEIPHYMQNRRVIDGTLEEELDTPFESYPLFRGNSLKRRNFFTRRTEVDFRSVGRFKGVIRVLKSRDEPPLFNLESFLNPQPYLVRVYVLDAMNIQPKDANNKCDPYLRLSLGDGHKRDHVFNDRESHRTETLAPKFHNMYEFKAELPGVSELRLEVLDYDFFAIPGIPHGLSSGIVSVGTTVDGDDFVGATLLDLEDRWFSSKWQQLGATADSYEKRKPLENRPLYAPSSTLPQGSVRLWIDILTPHEIKKVSPLDISLPPIEKFEVRVIVYKAKNVTPGDFTDLSDLLVKCWLQNKDEKAQSTDTHWRAKNGKASFNWRMKFDLELPIDPDSEADKGYLHFQMWDKDLLYDDCLADSVVDLSMFLKQAYRTKQIVNVFAKKKSVRGLGKDSMPISSRGGSTGIGYSTSSVYDSTRAPMSSTSSVSIDIDSSKQPLLGGAPTSTGSSFFSSQAPENVYSSQASGDEQARKKHKKKKSHAKDNAESLVQSVKQRLGMGDDPEDASWLTMTTRDAATGDRIKAGDLLVSIEILPVHLANARAAGLGRSEPNNFPFLPEPADRLHLSAMWNPLYVLEALMGPKFYRAFSSCMVCTLFLALIIFAGPLVNVFLTIVSMLPSPIGWVVFGGLVFLMFSSFCYCTFQCNRAITGSRD